MIKETLETRVAGEYEVAVCGGGFAGISAALASARQGKKTVLFERSFMLGGLGTAGLVTIYLPLCDGFGKQVSFGIAEELFRLSISMGAEARYPENWLDGVGSRTEKDKRFEVQYNAQLFAILAEKLLLSEGVDILYGTYAVGVDMDGDRICHIITENKSGRQAYKTVSVVDATGDADIAKFANAPTKLFEPKNILAAWYYFLDRSGLNLNMLGYADILGTEEIPKLSPNRYTGVDGKEISDMMCEAHSHLLEDVKKRREKDSTLIPVTMATIPQLRMTRRIDGEYTMEIDEEHKHFDDSIGMVSNWRKRGPVYEVPFRTLYSSKVKNLICAGRITSVGDVMWDIMRVIPCCAVTGEAAGVAAAMTDDFSTLDVKALQSRLVENGVVLHESDL